MTDLIYSEQNLASSRPLIDVIEDFISLKNSKHTQRAYRSDLTGVFKELGFVLLEDLAEYKLHEIVNRLQYAVEKRKIMNIKEDRKRITNARTINRLMNSLRSFFKYLVDTYNYPKNPMHQFAQLPVDQFSNTESLTRGEIIDLLEFTKRYHRKSEAGYRNYLILIFLFNLALRCEECATLQWNDLNLNDQVANIFQKGGSFKLLPLPHSLCLLLQEFKSLYGNDCPYIFHPIRNNSHKALNKPLSSQYVFAIVKKHASEVVKNKKISPHSLRKTFIELALDNNQDLIAITNATGHRTIEMIKYYDTRDRLKNNAVNSLAGLI